MTEFALLNFALQWPHLVLCQRRTDEQVSVNQSEYQGMLCRFARSLKDAHLHKCTSIAAASAGSACGKKTDARDAKAGLVRFTSKTVSMLANANSNDASAMAPAEVFTCASHVLQLVVFTTA